MHEYTDQLKEAAADFDEGVMEKYLEGEEISPGDEIRAAIRKGAISLEITPMFCGTAFKNKGVQLLLDAVIEYLPSPVDRR